MDKINGLGSVYHNKTKGKWVAQYYVTSSDGLRKKKFVYGNTKREVVGKLQNIMYEYRNEKYIANEGMQLIRLLEESRQDKYAANLISDSHYSRLEFVLKEIASSNVGKMNIRNITSRDLQDFFNSLINKYSDSTIKKIWECVKQGFTSAVKKKYIIDNPFDDILKPKSRIPTKVVEAMTVSEQEIMTRYLISSSVTKEKYKNVILLMLYSGARIGEALALTKDDVDLRQGVIHIKNTVSLDMEGNQVIKKGTKTYAGIREVGIPDFVVKSMKDQIDNYFVPNPNDLIFHNNGKIIKPSSVNTVLKRIDKQLGLPETISNHVLRHTYGTRAIESGMSPSVVQRMMGHKDIRVTLNTYTSVLNKFKQDESVKLAKYYMENHFGEIAETEQVLLDKADYQVMNEDIEEYDYNTFPKEWVKEYTLEELYKLFGSKEEYEKAQMSLAKECYKREIKRRKELDEKLKDINSDK